MRLLIELKLLRKWDLIFTNKIAFVEMNFFLKILKSQGNDYCEDTTVRYEIIVFIFFGSF